jgi:hypothetical protein
VFSGVFWGLVVFKQSAHDKRLDGTILMAAGLAVIVLSR